MTDRWRWEFLNGSREEVEAIKRLCDHSIEPLLLQGVAAVESNGRDIFGEGDEGHRLTLWPSSADCLRPAS